MCVSVNTFSATIAVSGDVITFFSSLFMYINTCISWFIYNYTDTVKYCHLQKWDVFRIYQLRIRLYVCALSRFNIVVKYWMQTVGIVAMEIETLILRNNVAIHKKKKINANEIINATTQHTAGCCAHI